MTNAAFVAPTAKQTIKAESAKTHTPQTKRVHAVLLSWNLFQAAKSAESIPMGHRPPRDSLSAIGREGREDKHSDKSATDP